MKLDERAINEITNALEQKRIVELHIEKENIVIVDLTRKVITKIPYGEDEQESVN